MISLYTEHMCQYCNYGDDGWDRLLDYDDVYRSKAGHPESDAGHDADSDAAAGHHDHSVDVDDRETADTDPADADAVDSPRDVNADTA